MTQEVDWTSDSWFAGEYAGKISEDFKKWWVGEYGEPSAYSEGLGEQDEYWVRCAFAWKGWAAGAEGEREAIQMRAASGVAASECGQPGGVEGTRRDADTTELEGRNEHAD